MRSRICPPSQPDERADRDAADGGHDETDGGGVEEDQPAGSYCGDTDSIGNERRCVVEERLALDERLRRALALPIGGRRW